MLNKVLQHSYVAAEILLQPFANELWLSELVVNYLLFSRFFVADGSNFANMLDTYSLVSQV